jgi:hypothetical protein
MACIPDWLSLANATAVLNSAFTTSLVGALAGAYAGARAAQIITERSKERDALVSQIKSTNAATMVCFSAFNAGVALKKQHVQSMHDAFEAAKKQLQEFKSQRASGQRQGNTEYVFLADMRTFQSPSAPIETLKDLVFNKISAYGRPLALVSVLEQSFAGLREAIAKCDALIQRFSNASIPKELFHCYYFGSRLPSGDTNQEFPDLVAAIHSYVDDIVFFGSLLCADLIAHGHRVHEAFTKKFGTGAPKVSTIDFTGPRESKLIPPNEQYKGWLNAFTTEEAQKATQTGQL